MGLTKIDLWRNVYILLGDHRIDCRYRTVRHHIDYFLAFFDIVPIGSNWRGKLVVKFIYLRGSLRWDVWSILSHNSTLFIVHNLTCLCFLDTGGAISSLHIRLVWRQFFVELFYFSVQRCFSRCSLGLLLFLWHTRGKVRLGSSVSSQVLLLLLHGKTLLNCERKLLFFLPCEVPRIHSSFLWCRCLYNNGLQTPIVLWCSQRYSPLAAASAAWW